MDEGIVTPYGWWHVCRCIVIPACWCLTQPSLYFKVKSETDSPTGQTDGQTSHGLYLLGGLYLIMGLVSCIRFLPYVDFRKQFWELSGMVPVSSSLISTLPVIQLKALINERMLCHTWVYHRRQMPQSYNQVYWFSCVQQTWTLLFKRLCSDVVSFLQGNCSDFELAQQWIYYLRKQFCISLITYTKSFKSHSYQDNHHRYYRHYYSWNMRRGF